MLPDLVISQGRSGIMFSRSLEGKTAILLSDMTTISGEVLEEDSPLILSGNYQICIDKKTRKAFLRLGARPLSATLDSQDILIHQNDLEIL